MKENKLVDLSMDFTARQKDGGREKFRACANLIGAMLRPLSQLTLTALPKGEP